MHGASFCLAKNKLADSLDACFLAKGFENMVRFLVDGVTQPRGLAVTGAQLRYDIRE